MARENRSKEFPQIGIAHAEIRPIGISEALQSSASPKIRFCELDELLKSLK